MKRPSLHRSNRAPSLALGALCALAGACSQGVEVPPPRAFNRPARVELVCFRGDVPVARDECDLDAGAVPTGFSLIALVPQETRGEVAAVDLGADPPRVIDSDRRVPGFTFVQVGGNPSAIAVSRRNPACTWVANTGSSDLWAVQTARFREESLADEMRMDPRTMLAGAGRMGRPHAMVIHDEGAVSELYVTLPGDGVIARVPVTSSETECVFGAVEIIPLPDEVPEPPATPIDEPTLTGERDPATLAVCTAAGAEAPEFATPGPVAVAPLPATLPEAAPREIIVERNDAGQSVALWIGDAARPVIYRYDLAARAFGESIRTDGPIRDLTLTAPVPDALGSSATRRYLYAIDDRDGSVMVIDASSGHVVPVAPELGGRPLRVGLPAPARAIEAIDLRDTGLAAGACTSVPTANQPAPNNLRGVFVAVALSDGTVRFIDVFDEDAQCRAGTDCDDRFVGAEKFAFIRRHRPRIGQRITEAVGLADAPTVAIGGSTFRYPSEGKIAGSTLAPVFGVVDCAAEDGVGPVFGNLLCALTDPWSAISEQWAITWQGAIPQTSNVAGNLEDQGATIDLNTRLELCSRGALGAEGAARVSAGQPEAGYPGDLVAILAELPEGRAEDARCEELAGVTAEEDPEPLLVASRAILAETDADTPYRTTIQIDRTAPVLNRAGFTMGDIWECYQDELVGFELRVQNRFAVVGGRAGFQHRVVVDEATGQCVVDETQDPTLNARAALGAPYANRRLQFQLSGEVPAIDTEVQVRFELSDVPAQLRIDLGFVGGGARELTLPGELLFSEQNDTLYVLDELRRGLAPTTLAPLEIQDFIE